MAEYIIRTAEFRGIEIIPGEFREEIIRCRDCLFSWHDNQYCTRDAYDGNMRQFIEPDGFCAWAERVD